MKKLLVCLLVETTLSPIIVFTRVLVVMFDLAFNICEMGF
jgi:hypothetical protein